MGDFVQILFSDLFVLGAVFVLLMVMVSRIDFDERFPEGGVVMGLDGVVKGTFKSWFQLRRVLQRSCDVDVIVSRFPPRRARYLRVVVEPPPPWIPRSGGKGAST